MRSNLGVFTYQGLQNKPIQTKTNVRMLPVLQRLLALHTVSSCLFISQSRDISVVANVVAQEATCSAGYLCVVFCENS